MVVRLSGAQAACMAKESRLSFLTRKRKGKRRARFSLNSDLLSFREELHLVCYTVC